DVAAVKPREHLEQRAPDADRSVHAVGRRSRRLRDDVVEPRPRLELHRVEELLAASADVEEADHPVVGDRGEELDLAAEARAGLRVGASERLERDVPTLLAVPGAPDDGSASSAERVEHLVAWMARGGRHESTYETVPARTHGPLYGAASRYPARFWPLRGGARFGPGLRSRRRIGRVGGGRGAGGSGAGRGEAGLGRRARGEGALVRAGARAARDLRAGRSEDGRLIAAEEIAEDADRIRQADRVVARRVEESPVRGR